MNITIKNIPEDCYQHALSAVHEIKCDQTPGSRGTGYVDFHDGSVWRYRWTYSRWGSVVLNGLGKVVLNG